MKTFQAIVIGSGQAGDPLAHRLADKGWTVALIEREHWRARRPACAGSPSLRGLDVDHHLQDPTLKQRYVTAVFDLAAPRYDRFTRVFSYGMDRRWKRELLARLASLVHPGSLLGGVCIHVARKPP